MASSKEITLTFKEGDLITLETLKQREYYIIKIGEKPQIEGKEYGHNELVLSPFNSKKLECIRLSLSRKVS